MNTDFIFDAENELSKAKEYLSEMQSIFDNAKKQWGLACVEEDQEEIKFALNNLFTSEALRFDAQKKLWSAEDKLQNAKDRAACDDLEANCPYK